MNSTLLHSNSYDAVISKYEDEIKYLIKDTNQLNEIYKTVKDEYSGLQVTESIIVIGKQE